MSKPKFTPGPWTVVDGPDGVFTIETEFEPNGQSGELVAHIPVRDVDTDWANARLISAAPELLETLQGFLNAEEWDPDFLEYFAVIARRAVKKATGGDHGQD